MESLYRRNKRNKAIREKRLLQSIDSHKEFLIKRLQEEWDEIQKTAKREELIRRAKGVAKATSKILLALLLVGGMLTVAAIAPNVFAAYGRMSGRRGFFDKKNFIQSKKYLKKQKYISFATKEDGTLEITLTKKGSVLALKDAFDDLRTKKSKKWDGFWRLILFDIPNKHKWARDGLRSKLKEIGCYQLQESVFITPYPCEEEIAFLTSIFNVDGYVRFIKTQYLYHDQDMRARFDL